MGSEEKKEITTAEILRVFGKANIKAAEYLEDPDTPNVITKSEWMKILQDTAGNAWDEYNN